MISPALSWLPAIPILTAAVSTHALYVTFLAHLLNSIVNGGLKLFIQTISWAANLQNLTPGLLTFVQHGRTACLVAM